MPFLFWSKVSAKSNNVREGLSHGFRDLIGSGVLLPGWDFMFPILLSKLRKAGQRGEPAPGWAVSRRWLCSAFQMIRALPQNGKAWTGFHSDS